MKSNRADSGFTLVEMMVALFLGVIATAGMYLTYVNYSQAADTQNQTLELQQALRVTMNRMIKDIRMAGYYNPDATPIVVGIGITIAEDDEIKFTRDLNEDGDVDPSDDNENITFGIHNPGSDLGLFRKDGDKPREYYQKGLDKAAGDKPLNFVYLDKDRIVLDTPVIGDDLQKIKFVQISLVFKSTNEDPSYNDLAFTYTNLHGTTLITGKNDHFRRQRLSTEVNVRNVAL